MLIEARKTATWVLSHSLMQGFAFLNTFAQKCDCLAERTRSGFLQRGERTADRDPRLEHRSQLVIQGRQVFGGRFHSCFAAISNDHHTLPRNRGKLNRETNPARPRGKNGPSSPAAGDPHAAAAATFVVTPNPNSPAMGWPGPTASHPDPASAVPSPRAVDPHVTRARCRIVDFFHYRRRWRLSYHDFFILRRWRWRRRSCVSAAGRVDHDVDDPLADTGVLEIDDLRGAQVIGHVRITDLADDDLIADARFRECLDVRGSQRLTLVDALQRLRGILTHAFPLLLVDGIANDG